MRSLALALVLAGCSRASVSSAPPAAGDASSVQRLAVRVPAALSLARGLDTLSVSIDPASLALTDVEHDPAMTLGIESDVAVFPRGHAPAPGGVVDPAPRNGASSRVFSGIDFDRWSETWNTSTDGLPVSGVKYEAEVQLVLFETDVPPGHMWDPHAGHYRALWSRTLRQAEE